MSDNAVQAFIGGTLSGESLERAHAHIDRCSLCHALVVERESVGHHADGSMPTTGELEPGELAPGRSLGRYQVRAKLGAGAMGVVYHARDTLLERDVALKVLRQGRAPSAPLEGMTTCPFWR